MVQLAVAPVFLLTAIGTVIAALNIRLGRAVDRRRHLEAAEEKGLVSFEDVAEKVGRPSRRWLLTEAGHARFPDRHAELTLQLIDQVRTALRNSTCAPALISLRSSTRTL